MIPSSLALSEFSATWLAICRKFVARFNRPDGDARLSEVDSFGGGALHRAAFRSDLQEVNLLLDTGADVNARDNSGGTPLHLITGRPGADFEVCRLLIERGADVNSANHDGRRPLHNAAARNRQDVCRLLLDSGAHPNVAATAGVVEGLSDNSEVNVVTPLHFAAKLGAIDVCRLLVDRGALPSWMREDNAYRSYLTPFQLVVRTGPVAMVQFFVEECGEDICQITFGGRTLFQLSQEGSAELAYLLSRRTEEAVLDVFEFDEIPTPSAHRRSSMVHPL